MEVFKSLARWARSDTADEARAMALASSAVSDLAHLASDLKTSMTRMHLDQ